MNYRRLGRTGWSVSEIGYGMWGMGNWNGTDDELTVDVLQCAIDLGCNFFDTALAYGEGRSEALLGQVVRANPNKRIYTSAKVPPLNRQWPRRREFTLDDCFPPEHIEGSVVQSLKNTGLERRRVLLFHPWEDSWLRDYRCANRTMPKLALRFTLSNPLVSPVIPGMRRSASVEANVAASDAGPLPEDLLRKLRAHRWERQPTEWSQ